MKSLENWKVIQEVVANKYSQTATSTSPLTMPNPHNPFYPYSFVWRKKKPGLVWLPNEKVAINILEMTLSVMGIRISNWLANKQRSNLKRPLLELFCYYWQSGKIPPQLTSPVHCPKFLLVSGYTRCILLMYWFKFGLHVLSISALPKTFV